jgi:hypothetical protein
MLPSRHEYVKTHQKFKDTFGGSNMVTIMLEVDKGDIFDMEVLEKVRTLTLGLREVSAVNPFQITSLASKKLKEVRASTDGIETRPLMWPELRPTPKSWPPSSRPCCATRWCMAPSFPRISRPR